MAEIPHARYSDQVAIARPLAQKAWYRSGAMEVRCHTICPNCNSSDLQRASLIHAAGMYESRGRVRGLLLASGDALLLGRYGGTSQSRLSKMVGPPIRIPYVSSAIVWLVGFFPVMAFAGRGKLSTLMEIVSVAYLLLLPSHLLAALSYNLIVRPKKCRSWEATFMCQYCGALIEPHSSAQSRAQA
jgi:predicted RNA-binding Zn-ribbon protein involved in translation (DUF1610 family)